MRIIINLLEDIITYVRRIIKSPSNADISDALIIDYINRFWINDVDARVQLFDFKTKYQFQTTPGVDQYNMPMYDIQPSAGSVSPQSSISFYPVYQGFLSPATINGIEVTFQTQRSTFFSLFPNVVQYLSNIAVGNGTAGPYTLNIPLLGQPQQPLSPPITALLRGHVDITGIVATGVNMDPPLANFNTSTMFYNLNDSIPTTSVYPAVYFTAIGADGSNIVVADSGQFLPNNQNYGLLMSPGRAPFGNQALSNAGSPDVLNAYDVNTNTINYLTGVANVVFPQSIPQGAQISAQCFLFATGLPRAVLFYNNTIILRSPPDQSYLVELEAYLSPAAFLMTTQKIQFAYMCEYIARGAARKILSDTGDIEQLQFYEPLFREQEMLVWKRSQRQFTSTRTQTIYSSGPNQGQNSGNGLASTSS